MYIGRHAEVNLDKQDRIRGLDNPSLNEKGQRDAKKLVELFADIPLSAIYSDDLARTIETATPLAEAKGLPLKIDTDLRSWDVGSELEGQPLDEHREEIDQLKGNPEQIPVAGQSWGSFCRQVQAAFRRHMDESLSADAPVLFFTHGSALQVIWEELGEEGIGEDYLDIPVEPAGIVAIYLTREGFKPVILSGEGVNEDE